LLEIVQAVEESLGSGGLVPVNRQQKPAIDYVNHLCARSAEQMQAQLAKVTLAQLAELCAPAKGRARKAPAARKKATRRKIRGEK
jgi:hypothetical protein